MLVISQINKRIHNKSTADNLITTTSNFQFGTISVIANLMHTIHHQRWGHQPGFHQPQDWPLCLRGTTTYPGCTAHPLLLRLFSENKAQVCTNYWKGQADQSELRRHKLKIIRNLRRGEPHTSKEPLWTNLILKDMITVSAVTIDYVTETLYRVPLGSTSIRYLL